MRAILKRIILWALADTSDKVIDRASDAAALDELAKTLRR